MIEDKTDVEIYGRKLTIELEGFNQLEVSSIANYVDGRMREIAKDSKVVDTSKLALLTAIEIAAELQRVKTRMEDFDRIEERRIDGMIVALEKSAEPDGT
ncbi:MAG: cell division protein ZapA [Elusimicrobiota bacterium]